MFYFHGWPGSRVQARLISDTAWENNLHVIAPDRPGIGGSPYDPDRKLLDWPNTVLQLAEHLNWNRFSVLGVSGGGPYAISCAAAIPERLIKTGVCVGIPSSNWLDSNSSARWIMRAVIKTERALPGSLSIALKLAQTTIRLMPGSSFLKLAALFLPKVERAVLKNKIILNVIAASVRESFCGPTRGLAHDLKLLTSDWGFTPEEIKADIRWWHGGKDTICPLESNKPASVPESRLNLILSPDEGHYSLPIRKSAEIIKFFAED